MVKADLHLCFHIGKNLGFLASWLILILSGDDCVCIIASKLGFYNTWYLEILIKEARVTCIFKESICQLVVKEICTK